MTTVTDIGIAAGLTNGSSRDLKAGNRGKDALIIIRSEGPGQEGSVVGY